MIDLLLINISVRVNRWHHTSNIRLLHVPPQWVNAICSPCFLIINDTWHQTSSDHPPSPRALPARGRRPEPAGLCLSAQTSTPLHCDELVRADSDELERILREGHNENALALLFLLQVRCCQIAQSGGAVILRCLPQPVR